MEVKIFFISITHHCSYSQPLSFVYWLQNKGSQGHQDSVPWRTPTFLLVPSPSCPAQTGSALRGVVPRRGMSLTWTPDAEFPASARRPPELWVRLGGGDHGKEGRRAVHTAPGPPWVFVEWVHACRPPARGGGWISSGSLVVNLFPSPKQKWCELNGALRSRSFPRAVGRCHRRAPLLSQDHSSQGCSANASIHRNRERKCQASLVKAVREMLPLVLPHWDSHISIS